MCCTFLSCGSNLIDRLKASSRVLYALAVGNASAGVLAFSIVLELVSAFVRAENKGVADTLKFLATS